MRTLVGSTELAGLGRYLIFTIGIRIRTFSTFYIQTYNPVSQHHLIWIPPTCRNAMAASNTTTVEEKTELSDKYDTPLGLAHDTMQALKDRIKKHYDLASEYYLNLWGTHIHHGYWPTPESKANESKEQAQLNLIRLLLDTSHVSNGAKVLDVGCGIGGTSRYLASQLGCTVTGITISTTQVEMATRLTKTEAANDDPELKNLEPDEDGFFRLGKGKVKFIELDAEKMGDVFASQSESFDAVWICEALSHFPNKALFFQNAHKSLKNGGKLALADWFKAEGLDEKQFADDIKPIEGELVPLLALSSHIKSTAGAAGWDGTPGRAKEWMID